MTRRLIDIDQTVAASSEITAEASLSSFANTSMPEQITDSVTRQATVTTSTDVDVHLEARLDDDLSWAPIDSQTGLDDGTSILDTIETERVSEIQLRVVNNDGTNSAGIRAVVLD